MCGFTIDLIDFDQLSDAQKKALVQNYQRIKKDLETQLKDTKKSLKGIDRALKVAQKKSKRRT
jgi:ferritin-like metal-binding protein YciE